jgi:hypothetical protein
VAGKNQDARGDREEQRAMIGTVNKMRWNVAAAWNRTVKRTIARFVRGNIAAQNFRIKLPEEQQEQHDRARRIAERWRARLQH